MTENVTMTDLCVKNAPYYHHRYINTANLSLVCSLLCVVVYIKQVRGWVGVTGYLCGVERVRVEDCDGKAT